MERKTRTDRTLKGERLHRVLTFIRNELDEPIRVTALAGIGLHTAAMLAVTAAIAAAVYEWLGLEILRSAWINIDLVWTVALAAAGLLLLAAA